MTRMENAARGVDGSREICLDWSRELTDAAIDASGYWTRFIKSNAYKKLSQYYPYHCRSAFNYYSDSPLKGSPHDPLFPTYFQCHFGKTVIEEIDALGIDYSPSYTQEEQESSYDEQFKSVQEEYDRMEAVRLEEEIRLRPRYNLWGERVNP